MKAKERMALMEKWKRTIEEASSSGIGIRIWCRENGISASQYYYWHKVLVDEGMISKHKSLPSADCIPSINSMDASVPVFAEIDLGHSSAFQSTGCMPFGHVMDSKVIIQRNNCQVFVGEGFSTSTLSKVLEVIGNAS